MSLQGAAWICQNLERFLGSGVVVPLEGGMLYSGWVMHSFNKPSFSPVRWYLKNLSDTETYWLTPSWAPMVDPVVQRRRSGSIKGASVTEG